MVSCAPCRLANLNNFVGSGVERLLLAIWYLALGLPRRTGAQWPPLDCKGPIREVVGVWT